MKFGPVRGRIMAWTHLQALQRIEKPVGCSQSVAAYLKSHGVEADFIRNGVDRDRFYPADQTTSRNLRKKLGLSVSALIFVSVGHLRNRKDPLTVIGAFKSSNVSDKSELVMIGEGPLQKECKNSAKGNSNIHFTGRIDNVEEYLQASDVFVSASKSEGLPNTVMEAISTGLPVILSDINPHKEIIEHNPSAGITFQVGDVCSATSALNSVEGIDIDMAGRHAISIAKNDLNARIMSEKYQSVYRSIEKKRMT
jgi:glycosyltransferase involved in cell wall biosynthesis